MVRRRSSRKGRRRSKGRRHGAFTSLHGAFTSLHGGLLSSSFSPHIGSPHMGIALRPMKLTRERLQAAIAKARKLSQ